MFASNTSAANGAATYIEDVFSTYLYTGNGSTQTINNGIDLAGKGGLVWKKQRETVSGGYANHTLTDTVRGAAYSIFSDTTDQQYLVNSITSFNSDGFSIGNTDPAQNVSGKLYASWTFRKQPKFFDVVTYTGNGSGTGVSISHALGSVPGVVMVKCTSTTGDWRVLETSTQSTLNLNATTASPAFSKVNKFGDYSSYIAPTSTTVYVNDDINTSGQTYVMYLFASNAGGFGLTGTDNVISCGSFTSDGSSPISVNLGYEPQWVLVKASTAAGYDWWLFDNMRGTPVGSGPQMLRANTSGAENTSSSSAFQPNATGFTADGSWLGASTFIYIAIRRGPMKVPTTGTSVFGLSARSGTGANATVTGGAGVTDLAIIKNRGSTPVWLWVPRLAGTRYMSSNQADVEIAAGTTILQANPWDVMDGVKVGTTSTITNASSNTFINYLIDRAPGFMDVVCDTGTGSTHTIAHNLTVIPEFYIRKDRTGGGSNWVCYHKDLGATQAINLNQTVAAYTLSTVWNNTAPTTSVFTVGTNIAVNSGVDYVTYLFASAPGVSKVGSYTGTGTTQQINCGFTAGSRFVLIKRTDSTGDWYVWDSARGIVAGNDPYLLLNSTAAEVTSTDYIDPVSSGFEISSTAPAAINASGGTFIFLAIA